MKIIRKPMVVANTNGEVVDWRNMCSVVEVGRLRIGWCFWSTRPKTVFYSNATPFSRGWQIRVWRIQVGIGIAHESSTRQ